MADSIPSPDQDTSSMMPGTPGQKRKRSSEQSSPDSRRSKRGAPAAVIGSGESVPSSFMDNTDMASAAAAANVNVADFSALQAAANESHNEAADPANASSTAAAALDYPNIHLPHTSEESFTGQTGIEGENHGDTQFTASELTHAPDGLLNHPVTSGPPAGASVPASVPAVAPATIAQPIPTMPAQLPQQAPTVSQVPQASQVQTHPAPVAQSSPNGYGRTSQQGGPRPAVGSEEWHKIRKDNHKEVERRRRETINEGINELSKIVPGCEKNKGSILQRAVAFITQLKENEAQNIEKWTLEKLLTEQAIAELSASNDKLKQECDGLYEELGRWKRHCAAHGVSPLKEESTSHTPDPSDPSNNATASNESGVPQTTDASNADGGNTATTAPHATSPVTS